jgi:outer membrane protein assembly factor BamB
MFRKRICLAVILVSLCISSRGLCEKSPTGEQTAPPEEQLEPLVPVGRLEQVRLTFLWESKLALEEPERVQKLFVRGGSVYALTDQNYLLGINKNNGRIRFGKLLISPGFSVLGPQLFEGDLFFTAGNSLLQIDTEFGREVGSKRFAFTVTAPIVRNEKHIYVAGNDRRLHVFDADWLEEFQVSADNDSVIDSILADNKYVIFSTKRGNVISISPESPLRNWQFNTAGATSAKLVADGQTVFVCSQDTNLYKLNADNGRMIWKFHTGARILTPARVTEKFVYQCTRYYGLYAIDKESGKQIWQLANGRDLLTEENEKAYAITNDGTIVVMDNQTGEQLFSVGLADISTYVSNDSESFIYVGDSKGRIACLKPAE